MIVGGEGVAYVKFMASTEVLPTAHLQSDGKVSKAT